jgi:PPOX class probable F420-dependent enzyme
MSLGDEKYISFTTFRKTGEEVATPTWVVGLGDGRVGFWTSSASGKAKRLANDARVTLQPSDVRGRVKPGSGKSTGTATLVSSGPDFDAVKDAVKARYGFMVPLTHTLNRIGHLGRGSFPYGDRVVVVSLTSSA